MNTRTLSEAEKMARVPGIVYVDGAAGRRARIAGTGLEVFELVEAWLSVDRDSEWLFEAFPWLTREQVRAALDFYALFPEEIDARLQREWEIDRMVEEAGGMTPELMERITSLPRL